ncbi:thermonuclease family protein [soil metagenome]
MRRLIVAIVVAVAALWLGAMGIDDAALTDRADGPVAESDVARADDSREVPVDAQPAVVTRVVDGDTIRVQVDDPGGALAVGEHRVRLLEIDSPEMDAGTGVPECGAAEATAYLRARLSRGDVVRLESDRENADRYGRALRYVWSSDGHLLNRALVASGNARAVLYAPNDRHWAAMTAAEGDARAADAGIWGSCLQQ